MRGLYIHIPFCKHICNYCDFFKMVTFNENKLNTYIDRVIEELDLYKEYYSSIETVYIGGGTPNILSDYNLDRLLNKISSLVSDIKEYTIEINPELLTQGQVDIFNKYSVNRISIGAQSFNNDDLSFLGRHHNYNDIVNSINLLKANNITNINVDIIYGHPNDTISNLNNNLKAFLELKIPHISLYSMILEQNTVFSFKVAKNELFELDSDIVADMMEIIEDKLAGYHHYEISNYSLPGYESIHNKIYWETKEYIGVGAGASGYLNGVRYDNVKNINQYLNEFKKEELVLTDNDKKSEYFIMGLRLLDGVSRSEYISRFGNSCDDDFDIKSLVNKGLVSDNNDVIKLTHKGYMLANCVFEEFI